MDSAESAREMRMKFRKTGKLKYISHLDLCRTMQSSFTRARIPIWYTQGFNPHPKMVFALPLPIFSESDCEYMDFRVTDPDITEDELCRRYNSAVTTDLAAERFYSREGKCAFSDITHARYLISSDSSMDISPLDNSEIIITKKTKRGESETDIKPLIGAYTLNDRMLDITLCAREGSYISPEYIASYLRLTEYQIRRVAILTANGGVFE